MDRDKFRRDAARSISKLESQDTTLHLRRSLEVLTHGVQQALKELEAGARINPLLLQHAADISQLIGRWNLLRELAPMLEGDDAP